MNKGRKNIRGIECMRKKKRKGLGVNKHRALQTTPLVPPSGLRTQNIPRSNRFQGGNTVTQFFFSPSFPLTLP